MILIKIIISINYHQFITFYNYNIYDIHYKTLYIFLCYVIYIDFYCFRDSMYCIYTFSLSIIVYEFFLSIIVYFLLYM